MYCVLLVNPSGGIDFCEREEYRENPENLSLLEAKVEDSVEKALEMGSLATTLGTILAVKPRKASSASFALL